jgi:hypothetical protein
VTDEIQCPIEKFSFSDVTLTDPGLIVYCTTPDTSEDCRRVYVPTDYVRIPDQSLPPFTYTFLIEAKGGASFTTQTYSVEIVCSENTVISKLPSFIT